MNGIKPNITFRIETPDGIILQEFDTNDISPTPQPEWKQYGFFFTTPPNNANIVLRMTNNAPGGGGNDLALDDITFRPCGPLINTGISGNTDTIDICEGDTTIFTFNANVSSNYQSPVYQWQVSANKGAIWKDIPGANDISYQFQSAAPGTYWYRLTVAEGDAVDCRTPSNRVTINVHAKPFVNAGPDRIVLPGISTTLGGKVKDGIEYFWTPDSYISNINDLTPTVSPPGDISYTLSAKSVYGCVNADNVMVQIANGIYVPNAFTPNNDGKNDTWKIPSLDPSLGADVSVFNRYGQLVYHCVGAIVSWDGMFQGQPQPAETYVYMITFKKGYSNLKGTVTIIR